MRHCWEFEIGLFAPVSWFVRHNSTDCSGIIRRFRNWFPVWFQQVFLMRHISIRLRIYAPNGRVWWRIIADFFAVCHGLMKSAHAFMESLESACLWRFCDLLGTILTDRSKIMHGFRNWFSVWLQQVFLRHNLNSVTNLRAQKARLVKNNCRFFRCLSQIH